MTVSNIPDLSNDYKLRKLTNEAFEKEQKRKEEESKARSRKVDERTPLERAQQGEYADNHEFTRFVRQAYAEKQENEEAKVSLDKDRKRLRSLASTIIKLTVATYPHLIKFRDLTAIRRLLRTKNKQDQGSDQDPIATLLLGMSPFVLFCALVILLVSPTRSIISTKLVLVSMVHALVICTSVLVLAAIRNKEQHQPKTSSNPSSTYRHLRQLFRNPILFLMRFPIWNVISVVLAISIAILGVISSKESLSTALLIGSITLFSTLSICFGDKSVFAGIQYLYFLMRDAWLSLRIASENLQIWLPIRLSRVSITVQEYINLANQYIDNDGNTKLPSGPFTKATRRVLEVWYEYNPFPSTPPIPATTMIPVDRIDPPNQPEQTEAEPTLNISEPNQNQHDEYFSNPVDRRIRDDESEI